ncbi:hypothetical protein BC830DRAFT_310135 [Chytriomyces sp. MP71]|nr:hypothetical protein BC830DRAFT_310135 [Chytriomyces sp. MP71]
MNWQGSRGLWLRKPPRVPHCRPRESTPRTECPRSRPLRPQNPRTDRPPNLKETAWIARRPTSSTPRTTAPRSPSTNRSQCVQLVRWTPRTSRSHNA